MFASDSHAGHEDVVWEETPCPLCGARDETLVIEAVEESEQIPRRVVCCRACGMVYQNPRPAPCSIGRYYPEDYGPYQVSAQPDSLRVRQRLGKLRRLVDAYFYGYPPPVTTFRERLLAFLAYPWLAPGSDSMTGIPFQGEGKLLEFGCGSGWFAKRMLDRGWQVTGMDFSAHAAAEVKRRFGIPTLVGSLPHAEVLPQSFDVITMGAVLEHVHEPCEIIEGATAALRLGGRLVISVPNIASWGFRTFGTAWWPLDPARHLLHFTPPTLRRLMERCGLEVESLRMLRRTSWMRYSVAAARRNPAAASVHPLVLRIASLRTVCGLLTRWSVWRGQGDCLLMVARKPWLRQPQKKAA